ncbi:MAG TPA: hypothetical protein VGI39_40095 [Polyangiaceae bacterium]|jgi:uncharacterized protein YggT (Ycf19 family)
MYRDSEIGVVFHHGVLTRSVFVLRLIQLLTLVFSAAYALLITRFLVEYVAAPAVPFVEWIRMVTDRVYLPLRAFVATGHDRAGHPLAWAVLVALAAIAVAQLLVVSSLRRIARPRLGHDDI